ncbi:hypothetical protein Pelo_10092 [Pelomyxa schiedti]|nr:hypothetical protein Pelo_10092 [Pelomyxa schiedti]
MLLHGDYSSNNSKTVNCYVIEYFGYSHEEAGQLLAALGNRTRPAEEVRPSKFDPVAVTVAADDLRQLLSDDARSMTSSAAKRQMVAAAEAAAPAGKGRRGVSCVVFHRDGSGMLGPGCANAEGAVVLAVMNNSTIHHVESLEDTAQRLGGGAPLIVADFRKQSGCTEGDGKSFMDALYVAFAVKAIRLLTYNGVTESSLKELILSVIQVTAGQQHPFQGLNRLELSTVQTTPKLPREVSMDIAWMDPLTVRSMLLLLSEKQGSSVHNVAIRSWLKVGNWPAVRELCFSCNNIHACSIGLEKQMLDCVPPQLEGISCERLDLSDNKIDKIPEWLLNTRIPWVELNNNPLKSLPPRLRSQPWEAIKSFLLFGEIPIKMQLHIQIVMVGGLPHHKAGLLKCLMKNKTKAAVRINNTKAIIGPVIKVHQPFKLERTDPYTWTAWELGGSNEDWNPFYPCFFNSNSVFILMFDAMLTTAVAVAKLNFWLTQLDACHKSKAAHTSLHCVPRPNVIVVGLHKELRDEPKCPQFLPELLIAIKSHWESKINFRGWYAVSLADGHGFAISNDYQSAYPDIILLLKSALQELTFTPVYIPPSWTKLRDLVVGTVATKNPILKWFQLVRIARNCGVGKTASTISPQKELEELRLCFDWLSSMGAIFHLRYTSIMGTGVGQSQALENNGFVILQPSWFTETITSITRSVVSACVDSGSIYEPLRAEHQAINMATLEHLSRLGMLMDICGKPYMSFFLLPAEPPNLVDTFWNNVKTATPVHGCMLKFGFLPAEAFSTVMCSLCNIPGVVPASLWRDGIVASSKTCDGTAERTQTFHLLMTRVVANVTQETTVEVAMITDGGAYLSPCSWKNNLMSTAINLLKRTARSMIQSRDVNVMFVCPKCLRESKPAVPDWQNCFKELFSHLEIIKAVGSHSKKPSTNCMHHDVFINDIAPEDLFNPLSFMYRYNKPGLGPNASSECNTSNVIQKEPVTVIHSCFNGPDMLASTMEELIPELNTLNYLPDHQYVAKFVSIALQGGQMMFRFLERQPRVTLPSHLLPATTRGPVEEASPNQTLTLPALLKVCLEYPREHKGALDEALPMCLWEHILKDIAQGLNHLHGQHPPIAHGGVCVGNVLITSLDLAGSGPWAKITYGVTVADDDTRRRAMGDSDRSVKNTTPESVTRGNTLPSTQGDVWDFGILVHNVVAPLSYVELKSTSSPPEQPGDYAALETHNSPAVGNRDPQFSRGHGTQVERFQVGRALASGAFVVDAGQCVTTWHTTSVSPPSLAEATAVMHEQDPKQLLPIWARQLISLCLVADPLQRPSMEALLNIWGWVN